MHVHAFARRRISEELLQRLHHLMHARLEAHSQQPLRELRPELHLGFGVFGAREGSDGGDGGDEPLHRLIDERVREPGVLLGRHVSRLDPIQSHL